MELERVKVKHDKDPKRFVFVNAREFDPAVHAPWVDDPEGEAPAEPAVVTPPAAKGSKKK